MSASDGPRDDDDFVSWAGPGVPIDPADDVEFVLAPRLEAALRAYADAVAELREDERDEMRASLAEFVRTVVRGTAPYFSSEQRARIGDLLRKAGLPPLDER